MNNVRGGVKKVGCWGSFRVGDRAQSGKGTLRKEEQKETNDVDGSSSRFCITLDTTLQP